MVFSVVTPQSIRLGVAGAGVMGSGIALAALLSNIPVRLYDVNSDVLQRAWNYIETHLVRKNKAANLLSVSLTQNLADFAGCNLVIEAVPESLELKRQVFEQLDVICPPPAILATNTSTLSVTEIAAITRHPQRVAGMHFFNPAPVLPLVELVRGAQTDPRVIETLLQVCQKLGKTPVVAADTPGFIVNRVARPFYGEALRILGESAASAQHIDWLAQYSAGFRMGPFRLMDLIGIDVNYAATQSMYQQAWGEPRYRPHWLQQQMVQQRALGRKTGRGFYTYEDGKEEEKPPAPVRPAVGGGAALILAGTYAPGLEPAALSSWGSLQHQVDPYRPAQVAFIPAGRAEGLFDLLDRWEARLPADIPLFVQAADTAVSAMIPHCSNPARLVGFDGLFFANGPLVTVVRHPLLDEAVRLEAERWLAGLGKLAVWVDDTPGLVAPRLVSMLANEAAFAVQDGVADAETIDQAMRLGVNYPYGPLEWARRLGLRRVLAVLEHLQREYGEDRYRPAMLLRRWARLESA